MRNDLERRFAWPDAARATRAALIGVTIAASAPCAFAATDSDTMTVTATVIASCNVTANDMAFGNYDSVASSPLAVATTIDVVCTNGTAYVVALDEGLGSGATSAVRKLTDGAATLDYALFHDPAHSDVWGDDPGVDTLAAVGTGAVQSHDVYGLIPANQTAPAGDYEDTVTVTVTY